MSGLTDILARNPSIPPPAETTGKPPADFSCPSVEIRPGASTYTVAADPREPSPLNTRYQASFVTTARECRLQDKDVVLRLGIQGRVIVGPEGGPGRLEVPIRYAVVHEGPEPKVIATRLERISVVLPDDSTNVLFTHIEEEIRFPMPPGADIDFYVVYVGFDALAARDVPRRRPPPRRP